MFQSQAEAAIGRAVLILLAAQAAAALVVVQPEDGGWVVLGADWQEPVVVSQLGEIVSQGVDEDRLIA